MNLYRKLPFIPYKTVNVIGEPLQFLYTDLNVSALTIPLGEEIIVSATVKNMRDYQNSADVNFYMDGKVIDSKSITLLPRKSEKVSFQTKPEKGIYKVRIGNTTPETVEVYPHHPVDIRKCELKTHCSGTARPCEFYVDQANNRYTIIAGGTDFLHAEDSYGAIYLKGVIKGNFIATLKVVQFGENVNPWYRAGIFLRNDIAKSHETEPGSLSSVLMYTTPKLSGFQWDEFGDGCMHKCGDRSIYETENPFPVWLKLVRHGDTFTGYTSYARNNARLRLSDGVNWSEPKHSNPIPGLADAMDIGMAAGTIDQVPALVVLEDFTLEVEDEGWK